MAGGVGHVEAVDGVTGPGRVGRRAGRSVSGSGRPGRPARRVRLGVAHHPVARHVGPGPRGTVDVGQK